MQDWNFEHAFLENHLRYHLEMFTVVFWYCFFAILLLCQPTDTCFKKNILCWVHWDSGSGIFSLSWCQLDVSRQSSGLIPTMDRNFFLRNLKTNNFCSKNFSFHSLNTVLLPFHACKCQKIPKRKFTYNHIAARKKFTCNQIVARLE